MLPRIILQQDFIPIGHHYIVSVNTFDNFLSSVEGLQTSPEESRTMWSFVPNSPESLSPVSIPVQSLTARIWCVLLFIRFSIFFSTSSSPLSIFLNLNYSLLLYLSLSENRSLTDTYFEQIFYSFFLNTNFIYFLSCFSLFLVRTSIRFRTYSSF